MNVKKIAIRLPLECPNWRSLCPTVLTHPLHHKCAHICQNSFQFCCHDMSTGQHEQNYTWTLAGLFSAALLQISPPSNRPDKPPSRHPRLTQHLAAPARFYQPFLWSKVCLVKNKPNILQPLDRSVTNPPTFVDSTAQLSSHCAQCVSPLPPDATGPKSDRKTVAKSPTISARDFGAQTEDLPAFLLLSGSSDRAATLV